MLFMSSPLVIILIVAYVSLLWVQFSVESFISLWVSIELLTFIFIGFTLLNVGSASSGVGSTMYFIVQSVLSLLLLLSGLLVLVDSVSVPNIFVVSFIVLANLGGFPFWGWYFSSVLSIPQFSLILALSLQKVPVVVLWSILSIRLDVYVILVIIVLLTLGMFLGFASACGSVDLRSVLVLTSIANNLWFILVSQMGEIVIFVFILVYAFSLSGALLGSNNFSAIFLVNLSGLPPFPIFFINLFVLTISSEMVIMSSFFFWWLVMLFSVVGAISYLRVVFVLLTTHYL